ncbi:MAG: hypothetical protein RL148_2072 [Planctomycetota bacterium]|jgi:glycogen debranching enzyme
MVQGVSSVQPGGGLLGPAGGGPSVPGPSREWLLVDGHGGYACGSTDDVPRRRYHGWLVARKDGSARRHLLLSRVEEVLGLGGRESSLMATQWRGEPAPSRPAAEVAFAHQPWPSWTFAVAAARLRRELRMEGTPGCVAVRYTNLGASTIDLRLRPMLSFRAHDALTFANGQLDPVTHRVPGGLLWRPYAELPPLTLAWSGAQVRCEEVPHWYQGVHLGMDEERGYECDEDQWAPCRLHVELPPGAELRLEFRAGAGVGAAAPWPMATVPCTDRWERLNQGADQFFFRAPGSRLGIVAGFPWFDEWGRDLFLALPGLTLARGDLARCTEVLRGVLPYLQDGLLPNIFGEDVAASHYGSADAALWFALAVRRWQLAGGDRNVLLDELHPALLAIAERYLAGTGMLQADGAMLLHAGSPDRNATWMDAMTHNGPVTPRDGQPVEINAVWCQLLAHLASLAGLRGDTTSARVWADRWNRASAAFVQRFWLPDGGYLADRWVGGAPDRTVRPNMVVAAALDLSPLSRTQRAGVVAKAWSDLVTPRGLRTLAPADPRYRPRFSGGPEERDLAYHQGTVWPWLLGFFVEAALAACPRDRRAGVARQLQQLLDEVVGQVDEAGLDHVSEVFDGNQPHLPGGTFAQAWNSGELLRARALVAEALG